MEEVGHWGRVLQNFVLHWPLPVYLSTSFPVSHDVNVSAPPHPTYHEVRNHKSASSLKLARSVSGHVSDKTGRWAHCMCDVLWLTVCLSVRDLETLWLL